MRRSVRTDIKVGSKAAVMVMIALLLWLTVSLPFVPIEQTGPLGKAHIESSQLPVASNEEDTSIPINSTTEESPSSNDPLIKEFLNNSLAFDCVFSVIEKDYKIRHAAIYIAFHGELIVPPPDRA